jgi:glycosyltransferase involved in cell wall biosynthesis
LAAHHPDWSIVLIGPDMLKEHYPKAGLDLPNVYFLGSKPIAQLPAYMKAIDVGLLPYSLTKNVLATYPLKLHEYLSAGKPVVSVDMPELVPFREVVSIARSYANFVACVERELLSNSPEKIKRRVEVARQNTWDDRVEEMSQQISRYLNARKE